MGQMVCRELTERMGCQVQTVQMVRREFKVWQEQMVQMGCREQME